MVEKEKIIKEFGTKDSDTGSVEVQVAILTERIKQITEHCKIHKKDFATRRGLLMLVSRRKRLLSYFKKTYLDRYLALIAKLGLKDNN
ncbi:MAG: 30S ribosomal protein S15 [Rickettsiales bacterium]|jgi:small subunit ribosomal protein S15|nr:30S ribosomal protein S15 [Rickettsiales bacterium]